jgi:pimeloyl-ACP methyl ester carboxylesterase
MIFLLLSIASSALTVGNFSQKLNHSDPASPLFNQSFFEMSDYFDPAHGLVILKIGSETWELPPAGVDDWFEELAKHFKATVITLQHRFFGHSQPFSDTSTPHLAFLTVEQALQDYAYLHDNFVSTLTHASLAKNTWVVIGGSYPGLLSANIRKRWPDKFAAAISSAGVVFATNDYYAFDLQDAITMGQECASLARTVRARALRLFRTDRQYIASLLNFSDTLTEFEFNTSFGDTFITGAQLSDITSFCAPLLDTLKTGADPLIAFAQYAASNGGFAENGTAPLKDTSAANSSEERCWFWMTCNEVAYWQTSPRSRLSLRGRANTTQFEDQCQDVFGFPMHPDVDKFNREHNVTRGNNVSHVAFITGSQDPWQWACVGEDTPVDEGNWVHTIKGFEVGHHREFNRPQSDDPEDMRATRAKLVLLLEQWTNWSAT